MLFCHWSGKKLLVNGMLVGVVLSVGCNQGNEPSPSPAKPEGAKATSVTAPTPTTAETTPAVTGTAAAPATYGVVLANKELGMTVSGPGAGNPGRALDVLEQQVTALLPELRDTYEQIRAQDPSLMGSLDVSMTIEPNGGVSEVRFPVRRVSHYRLTTAVFDQMRNWMFPQADLEVQFRFTLLFVPPGIDEASILLWEKRLGSRPVIEKPDSPVAPVVAAATPPPEKDGWDASPAKRREESPASTSVKSAPAAKTPVFAPASPPNRGKTQEEEIIGWYRVLYPSPLRAEPQESAKILIRLQKGVRVRVVRVVKGQWLEVRSVSNRPPGFLWWEDAMAEREERTEQR